MKLFGLVGHPLVHSFSRDYFTNKFKTEQIDCAYANFDIEDIYQVKSIVNEHSNLCGFNVTFPYKQQIISLLDKINPIAKKVGAVNTIKIVKGKLIGFNTDIIGFEALIDLAINNRKINHALILGSGGASKAATYVLNNKQIDYSIVSRTDNGDLTYNQIDEQTLKLNELIINATPLGMFPKVESYPNIPYKYLNNNHICIDMVYNPAETMFMRLSKQQGSKTFNGLTMLIEQAEAAWKIWNTTDL